MYLAHKRKWDHNKLQVENAIFYDNIQNVCWSGVSNYFYVEDGLENAANDVQFYKYRVTQQISFFRKIVVKLLMTFRVCLFWKLPRKTNTTYLVAVTKLN